MNISILSDVEEKLFTKELKKAPKYLNEKNEKKFYSIILSHFTDGDNLDEKKGNLILNTLCRIFSRDNNRVKSFVKGKFLRFLPFSDKRFTDQLFDLIFFIAKIEPQAFDGNNEIAQSFRSLIRSDPNKCLVILGVLSQKFADIEFPWPMFDLLFKCSQNFQKACPENYIALLLYLCRSDTSFLEGRGKNSFEKIESILVNGSDNCARTAYIALSKLVDLNPKLSNACQLDGTVILKHLKVEFLQPPVISFLLRVLPNPDDPEIDDILGILIDLARETTKASLIIIQLCNNLSVATYLAKNAPLWMQDKLVSQYYTVCILSSIFAHTRLRRMITSSPEFVLFIQNTVNDPDSGLISPLMVILRRTNFDENLVLKLSKNDVIDALVKKAQSLDEDALIHCILLIFNIFGEFDYEEEVPKLSPVCNYLVSIFRDNEANRLLVAGIISRYAHIPQCARLFERKKVSEIFVQYQDDKKLQKYAKTYQAEINQLE